ncbi:putative glycoside hydrolase subgroup catalytic core protein [Botrytis fragariae]|uniref:Putative glycoside hydrolase subgroup catalytic core protein n=1 Tax=Botrytis fragariae TaxID=1964551 RepID=A0A8H6AVJ5_9HELO|nr:putative glycoside hydrolase subgroup catalytic core protein [Botrytis fragariae]KAF5874220.1 putative glycoside hydrolase subgroup catalytic core protein [Botrytis fragariae]
MYLPFLLVFISQTVAFNAPSDVPTWCGKPYMSTNHSLDPGGQFKFPEPQYDPLLYVTIQPRYSIFLESDEEGTFIVDASISHVFGGSYTNTTFNTPGSNISTPFTTLDIELYNEESALRSLHLCHFPDGQQTYAASTSVFVLPSREYGSAVKIDNLFGGLYVQNDKNDWNGWYAIFPNGYYADGSYVTPDNVSLANLEAYAALGFNTINIVPDGGLPDQSYPIAQLTEYWDKLDELNLFNLYDMRFAFQNSTRISEQVALWQNRTTLLSWYTADEPDGWAYPLNSTQLAYSQLKSLDPYHPVSLVLNCQNFYYPEYSAGADIIFQDAYPVAINATWSIPWGTPCNETYGDCGCDNCVGELEDVATRLDDIQNYQANIGPGSQGGLGKPTWSVVQAFGESQYWQSIPSAAEVEVMMMLSVNHDAKGITYWIYPSTDSANAGSADLGKVLQNAPAIDFLFGTNAIKGLGNGLLDVSLWVVGEQMMVGIVNGEYVQSVDKIMISLPGNVVSLNRTLYGDSGWMVSNGKLSKSGLVGLEVDILVVNLKSITTLFENDSGGIYRDEL